MKDPSGKLARWSVKLQQFDFDLQHSKRKLNVVPDALSRSPLSVEVSTIEDNITLAIKLPAGDKFYTDMRNNILKDPQSYPQWLVRNGYVFKHVPSRIFIKSNVSDWKYLVPENQRAEVLQLCHDVPTAAHFGYAKTLDRVGLSYYWPKMRRDIYRYVKACKVCGAQKAPNKARTGLMGKEKNISYAWQVISIDIIGLLWRSSKGFAYILVALRTAINEVTGYSPAFLNFGRVVPCRGDYYKHFSEPNRNELACADPKLYLEDLAELHNIYLDIKERLHVAQDKNSKAYNLRKRDVEFFVGDFVWKRNKVLSNAAQDFAGKLAPRYTLCKKKISKLVYVLVNED